MTVLNSRSYIFKINDNFLSLKLKTPKGDSEFLHVYNQERKPY